MAIICTALLKNSWERTNFLKKKYLLPYMYRLPDERDCDFSSFIQIDPVRILTLLGNFNIKFQK